MTRDKLYTRQLERAIEIDNPKAIKHCQERLHKVQVEKETKLLGWTLIFMTVFTIASPFLIYLLGWY